MLGDQKLERLKAEEAKRKVEEDARNAQLRSQLLHNLQQQPGYQYHLLSRLGSISDLPLSLNPYGQIPNLYGHPSYVMQGRQPDLQHTQNGAAPRSAPTPSQPQPVQGHSIPITQNQYVLPRSIHATHTQTRPGPPATQTQTTAQPRDAPPVHPHFFSSIPAPGSSYPSYPSSSSTGAPAKPSSYPSYTSGSPYPAYQYASPHNPSSMPTPRSAVLQRQQPAPSRSVPTKAVPRDVVVIDGPTPTEANEPPTAMEVEDEGF